jgi:hypothetical protein
MSATDQPQCANTLVFSFLISSGVDPIDRRRQGHVSP